MSPLTEFYKYINPPGVFVAVLGVDGVGKSAVIESIRSSLLATTNKTVFIQHLRPGLLPSLARLKGKEEQSLGPVLNPHGSAPSGLFVSLFRLSYLTLDYILGYWLKIRPKIAKEAAVVIYDRYAYDMVLDPRRFRVGLPGRVGDWFSRLAPKPDLLLCLYAPPEVIAARKQELLLEETRRQVKALLDFAQKEPRAVLISTDGSMDEVEERALRALHDFFARREKKNININFPLRQYLVGETSFMALPSKRHARWIFPATPKTYATAWGLYFPNSFRGKMFKALLKGLSHVNFLCGDRIQADPNNATTIALQNKVKETFNKEGLLFALSVGTKGAFQKITAVILDSSGKVYGYIKIARTELAAQRLKNEAKTLKYIGTVFKNKSNTSFPKCLFAGEIKDDYLLIQSACPFKANAAPKGFNENYAQILKVLTGTEAKKIKFIESNFYKDLKSRSRDYPEAFMNLASKDIVYLEDRIGSQELSFGLMHGDFAPWNILRRNNEFFLYDWESSMVNAPAGLDAIHFLFQTNYLLHKLKGRALLAVILKRYSPFSHYFQNKVPVEDLIFVYLLIKELDEGKYDFFSPSSVERRNLIYLLTDKA